MADKKEFVAFGQIGKMVYHVSREEIKHPDPLILPIPHESGKGFNVFINKEDAIDFAKKTGRHVLNQYHFDHAYLSEGLSGKPDATTLRTMFMIVDDSYMDEMKNPSLDYVEDVRESDCIFSLMLTDELKELKRKVDACEYPIEKCADLAKDLSLVQIVTLKTSGAFENLTFEHSEEI